MGSARCSGPISDVFGVPARCRASTAQTKHVWKTGKVACVRMWGYDIVRVKVMTCWKNCKGNPKFREMNIDIEITS